MRYEIGAMSVGDILDRGLKVLQARICLFYLINLIVLIPTLGFQLAVPAMLSGQASEARAIGFLLAAGALLAMTVVLSPFGQAAVLYVIAQEFVDRRASLGGSLGCALRRFPSLFVVSIVFALLAAVGFCCCFIIPGFLVLVWFGLASQAVVVENLGPFEAFGRSQSLTAGSRWRLLGLYLILIAIYLAAFFGQQVLDLLLPSMEVIPVEDGAVQIAVKSYPYHVVKVALGFLVSVLVQTFWNICTTLFYFDLRIRKEGFDLELLAGHQGLA